MVLSISDVLIMIGFFFSTVQYSYNISVFEYTLTNTGGKEKTCPTYSLGSSLQKEPVKHALA